MCLSGEVEAPAEAQVEDAGDEVELAGEDVDGHTGHPEYAAGLVTELEGAGLQETSAWSVVKACHSSGLWPRQLISCTADSTAGVFKRPRTHASCNSRRSRSCQPYQSEKQNHHLDAAKIF